MDGEQNDSGGNDTTPPEAIDKDHDNDLMDDAGTTHGSNTRKFGHRLYAVRPKARPGSGGRITLEECHRYVAEALETNVAALQIIAATQIFKYPPKWAAFHSLNFMNFIIRYIFKQRDPPQ